MKVVVGGVGQLYQGDYDLGRLAAQRLSGENLGPGVVVEDFFYGAVAVAQQLQDLRPDVLVLVGSEARGRRPGSVERRRVEGLNLLPAQAQRAVEGAVTGHVTIDLLVEVADALGALPPRTLAVEVEPARTEPSEVLSPEASAGLESALEMVRAEVRRAPLFDLVPRIQERVAEGRFEMAPALSVVRDLLEQLANLDRTGSWGSTFALRDELRYRIAQGETGEGMDHLDWSLWWALIEELDRLQRLDAEVIE